MIVQVYSALPDPDWPIPAGSPSYKDISTLLVSAKKYSIEATPARLGFKGFIVKDGKAAHLILGPETTKLQKLLLTTMPKDLLPDDVLNEVKSEINSGTIKPEIVTGKRPKRYAHPYDSPNPNWNDNGGRLCNNCYNYANIRRTNNFAQPGKGSGYAFPLTIANSVRAAALSDGLQIVDPPPPPGAVAAAPAGPRHMVALVFRPGK